MTKKGRVVNDGGWGWVVVVASFLCHSILDGCVVSVGVVYTHLLDHFEESKSKTALVGSLFVGLALMLGTVSSILVERFGCRTVTILGGILTAIGFISSAFAPSINVLCFTYGTIAPTGIAFVSVPAVVIVSAYFEEKRSFALGVALCGTGIGTLIFPPVCELMIQEYGWRGMMLLMGGVTLNFIVGGALFRPQPFLDDSESIVIEGGAENSSNHHDRSVIPADGRPTVHTVKTGGLLGTSQTAFNGTSVLLVYSSCRIDTPFGSTPALARSTDGITSDGTHHEEITKAITFPGIATSCPELTLQFRSKETCDKTAKESKAATFKQVLCNPFITVYETIVKTNTARWFALFLAHNFVLFFWLDVPYVFLVDRAVVLGINTTSASFLLSIVGILDTIGQVVYGILGDKKFIDNSILYAISIMLSGIVVAAFPLCNTFIYMAFLSGLFGFFVSANYTLCSVLLIEHLGQRTLAVTCGIIMMCQGVGNLAGPPIAGMMFDILGRYDETFYVAGVFMFLSAIPTLCPYVVKRREGRKASTLKYDSTAGGSMETTAVSPMLA